MNGNYIRKLYNEGRYEDILREIQVNPIGGDESADNIVIVAKCFYDTGDMAGAAKYYELLLEKEPERYIIEKLYDIYKRIGVTLGKWEGLYNKATKYQDDNVIEYIKYECEKIKGASDEELLEIILPIIKFDYNEEIFFEVIELLHKNNQFNKAKIYLKKIIANSSNESAIKRAEAILENPDILLVQEKNPEISEIIEDNDNSISKDSVTKDSIIKDKAVNVPVKKKRERKIVRSVERCFEGVVGLSDIKKDISTMYNRANADIETNWNFFIGGEAGSGKQLVADIICDIMYKFCICSEDEPVVYSALSLQDDISVMVPEEKKGQIIIITDTEKLISDAVDKNGKLSKEDEKIWTFITECLERASKSKDYFYIFIGEKETMKVIKTSQPKLSSYASWMFMPVYSIDQLTDIAKLEITKCNMKLADDAAGMLRKAIHFASVKEDFSNIHSIKNLISAAINNMVDRCVVAGEDCTNILKAEDFDVNNEEDESLEELRGRLNEMIGLESVKESVDNIIRTMQIQEKQMKEGMTLPDDVTRHLLLVGPPGTGKSTVARLLGRIYSQLGILPSSGIFVEAKREDLVAEYEGQTSVKTSKVIKSAMGGVLFIDEAYSLRRENGNDPFGEEALTKILEAADDYKDRMIIMMAGYEKEMQAFINTNPGLPRRFPSDNTIRFTDYTEEQLYEIFCLNATKAGYIIETAAEERIKKQIRRQMNRLNFGNAGDIRNLFNNITTAMAVRLSNLTQEIDGITLRKITEADVISYENSKNESEKTLEDYLDELDSMIGLTEVKEEVRLRMESLQNEQKRKDMNLKSGMSKNMNTIFMGPPGTGKTTVAGILGKIYCKLGLLPENDRVVEVTKSDLVSGAATREKTEKVIESAMGGVLFVDEAYTLVEDNDPYGKEAYTRLLEVAEAEKDRMMIIFAGYEDKMREFLRVNEGMARRFPNILHFKSYSEDDLYKIITAMARKQEYVIAEDATHELKRLIASEKKKKGFGNAGTMRNILEQLVKVQQKRTNQYEATEENKRLFMEINLSDVEAIMKKSGSNHNADECLEQLNSLIGLESVKKRVEEIKNLIEVNQIRKKLWPESKFDAGTQHMIFAGAPGTGKTTVARIMGQIFGALGVISDPDKFIEVKRDDLIGKYQGHTSDRVKKVLEDAMGGVLFIDEAHSLVMGEDDAFGNEIVKTLVPHMENNREGFVVIMAGYEDKINEMLKADSGLRSRMNTTIVFEDYTKEEMREIFYFMAKKNHYIIEEGIDGDIEEYLEEIKNTVDDFANARTVRNVFERVVTNVSTRVKKKLGDFASYTDEALEAMKAELCTITKDDLRG